MKGAYRDTLGYTIKAFTEEDKKLYFTCLTTEATGHVGHIVDLQEYSQYRQDISETVEYLNEVKDILVDRMIDIATSGKWKKWTEEQAEGTAFNFTLEMLSNTGDKKVDLLFALYERISVIIDELE